MVNSSIVRARLRRFLTSAPVGVIAGLSVLYLLLGYLALPALLKWQLESQVPARLGHRIAIGELRFDPLHLRLEATDVALSDPSDRPQLAFRHLVVDLELRGLFDGAWTLSEVTVGVPVLHLERDAAGRHNFADLLERLAGGEPTAPAGDPPRFIVHRLALNGGRVELRDRALGDPLIAQIEPLQLQVDGLSNLPGHSASYRLSARSAAGESIEGGGALALAPLALKGTLSVQMIRFSTLARGLSRLVALDAPTGTISVGAQLDLGVDPAGAVTGAVQDIGVAITELSIHARGESASPSEPLLALQAASLAKGQVVLDRNEARFGELAIAGVSMRAPVGGEAASEPLLALKTLSLTEGRVGFEAREARIEGVELADGRVATALDALRRIDWSGLLRPPAADGAQVPASPAESPRAAASAVARAPAPASAPIAVPASATGTTPTPAASAPAMSATAAVAASAPAAGAVPEPVTPNAAAAGPSPWRVSVNDLQVRALALDLTDAAGPRSVKTDRLDLGTALQAEFGSAGPQLELDPTRLSVAGLRLQQGADGLSSAGVQVETQRVAVRVDGPRLTLQLDGPRLAATDGLTASQAGATIASTSLSLQADRVAVDAVATTLAATVDGIKLAAPDGLTASQAGATIASTGLSLQADRVALDAQETTLAATGDGIKLASQGLSVGGAPPDAPPALQLREATFDAGEVTLRSHPDGLGIGLARPSGAIAGLLLRRAADRLEFASAKVAGESLSVAQDGPRVQIGATALRVSTTGLDARQGADRLALQELGAELQAVSASSDATAAPPDAVRPGVPVVDARIDGAALRLAVLDVTALGAGTTVASLARAELGARSIVVGRPGGTIDLSGDALSALLADVVVRSPADATELLRVGRAAVSGGALQLKDRRFSADGATLADSTVQTWLDGQGRLSWATLFGGAAAPAGAAGSLEAADSDEAAAARPAAPWRVAVKSVEVDGTTLGFEDRRESPPFALALEALRARVESLDTAASTPMQLELQGRLASGGEVEVRGGVRADTGAADLEVRLAAIALAPVQTYLSKFARLQLGSGAVSAAGRLRYGDGADTGAKLSYTGSLTVDELALIEQAPERPFLTWDTVTTGDLALTLEPDGLDIGELRVEGPAGRLIIAEDQSVNLTDVLRPAATAPDAAKQAAAPPPPAEGGPTQATFPVQVARVRVSGGALEFADLSLRPQFGTRMHDLKGVITGLGTDSASPAGVQLDAQVDKFGSAKIRGRISVTRPETLTELELAFRNLEMRSLSPYVVKFAGYRIKSGRLALDLRYKVRQGKLLGENQAVLEQMELGEKVDSPGALDLPLELAVAILKDSKGVIDVAVPVSGDLSNPQFDYGAVIGKAVAGVLGGVVTAPFRALAALFGGSDEGLDVIRFDPGSSTLAPPERQKLETVARGLKERPALRLVVPPTYDPARDRAALKSLAVRTDVARRMGATLTGGEDPGPVDAANPRVQRAIEAAFSQRYAPAVLEALKRRAVGARPIPADAAPAAVAASGAASAASAATVRPGAPAAAAAAAAPAAFYRELVERMIHEAEIPDQALAALAAERGAAIVREISAADGLAANRAVIGATREATGDGADTVPLRLELEAAK